MANTIMACLYTTELIPMRDNNPPYIVNFYPQDYNVHITETGTNFNIQYEDEDDNETLLVEWYLKTSTGKSLNYIANANSVVIKSFDLEETEADLIVVVTDIMDDKDQVSWHLIKDFLY